MKYFIYIVVIIVVSYTIFQSTTFESNFIPYDNELLNYTGRIGEKVGEAAEIYWSGSSVKFSFKGTGAKAVLRDEAGDNYFNVIIDNDSIYVIRPGKEKYPVELAVNLSDTLHTIEIYKRTEWTLGKTWFYGIELDNGSELLASEKNNRKIEFFGNSITAGYAVEDYSEKDSPDSIFTNNYNTYGAITARYFNADAHFTVRSGIGIMVSWFPMIMPEMFDRLNPENPDSKWNFEKFAPDVVVINLFQNDSWLVGLKDEEQFSARFGEEPPSEKFIIDSYQNFAATIRETYPEAHIICMLGAMDITKDGSPWPGYVKEAVANLGDDNIYTLFVPFKNTGGHPKVKEQQVIADSLIRFIEKENILH